VAHRLDAVAVVDGGWGFGQVAAQWGTRMAIDLCHQHGLAAVSLSRAHHVGRLGDYAETLAASGLIGLVFAGGGEPGGAVAIYGSRNRLLGTNPMAIAVPTPPPQPPLVLDFATSALPEGRIAVARAHGAAVPPGCLLDVKGRPSTDPNDFYAGGALLPFGGHKGSALMLMIEILACTLARSAPISSPSYKAGNPTVILAWSISHFTDPELYARLVAELVDRVKHTEPAEGFADVLLPGELEARHRRERESTGVPLSEAVWSELSQLASEFSVPLPAPRAP